jgi:hypothetical protein
MFPLSGFVVSKVTRGSTLLFPFFTLSRTSSFWRLGLDKLRDNNFKPRVPTHFTAEEGYKLGNGFVDPIDRASKFALYWMVRVYFKQTTTPRRLAVRVILVVLAPALGREDRKVKPVISSQTEVYIRQHHRDMIRDISVACSIASTRG